jgi:putative membrane protein
MPSDVCNHVKMWRAWQPGHELTAEGARRRSMLASLLNTALFAGTGLALIVAFLFLYTRLTPYPEFRLIRDGNAAAAYALSGALIGFVLPLCAVIANTQSIFDLLLWGLIGFIIQLAVYGAVRFAIGHLERKVEEGSVAAGIYLGTCSLVVGLLIAACLIP